MGFIVLSTLVFIGAVLGAAIFRYQLSIGRKVAAALTYSVLFFIPIPTLVLSLLLPAIGLYVWLMDDSMDRDATNKTFAVAYLFAALGTWLVLIKDL